MAQPFISAQDLSDYLTRDVSSDPRTVIALDSACQIVRSYLGQQVNLVMDDVVALDGSGIESLLLPELPVIDVTEVVEADTDGTNTETLTVNDDYVLGGAGILWRVNDRWRVGKSNILVTYSHGWDIVEEGFSLSNPDMTPTVPTDIRMVALQVAARGFSAGATGAGTMQSESIGDYSYVKAGDAGTSPTGLLTGEMLALDAYRPRSAG